MPSVQQRVAELASTTADLIARLRELEELRERVRKAEISAQTCGGLPTKFKERVRALGPNHSVIALGTALHERMRRSSIRFPD